jgi:multidrug resistance efflux pump
VLRPQERLAALLGARSSMLLCEELTLRARLDLDQGRLRLAALELDAALATAVAELRSIERQDLTIRVAELEQLRAGVGEQARAATLDGEREPDVETLAHALARLEAALRARTAPGVSLG